MAAEIVQMPLPKANSNIVESLECALAEAKEGLFVGLIMIKLCDNGNFATRKIGTCSDLAVCGALEFAKHDIITANAPK